MSATEDEIPERNRCRICGQKIVIVGGRPVHLSDWLERRPRDDD